MYNSYLTVPFLCVFHFMPPHMVCLSLACFFNFFFTFILSSRVGRIVRLSQNGKDSQRLARIREGRFESRKAIK